MDEEMYKETEFVDMIDKEFKMHGHWRKTFLNGFAKKHRQIAKTGGPKVIYIRNNLIKDRFEGLTWANFKKVAQKSISP